MVKLTRREFLRLASAGLGGLALQQLLSGCQRTPPPAPIPTSANPTSITLPTTNTPSEAPQPASPTQVEAQGSEPTSSPAATLPDIAVARQGEPEEMTRRLLAALGGMERFVSQGSRVVIKPNICVAYHTYEYAATTNPWVVATLVRLALEAGAREVRVMDNPFGGSAEEAYARSGIAEQVQAAGGEMVTMKRFQFKDIEIAEGVSLRQTRIYDEILDADVLIDVPIAKHHSMARLTLGMKNLMGVIWDRGEIHQDFAQRLADLNSRVRPHLVVIDAVRALMDHGPTGGRLDDVKKLDTLIASTDVVAADSYATRLFGLEPGDLPYIQTASQMGLGRSDLENLRIEEISLAT